MNNLRDVVVVDGVRTPFAKAGDALSTLRAQDLGQYAMQELLQRLNVGDGFSENAGLKVDEVCIGNVGGPVDAANVSRVIAMMAGLHKAIPAYTVHRNCASGMEAIHQAYLKIAHGQADVMMVGGTESMSNIPLLFGKKMTALFVKLMRAKTMGQRLSALSSFRLSFLKPVIAIQEALMDPFCGLNMGQTAEVLAREFGISREDQDKYAINSHDKTIAAQEAGRLAEEIVPVPVAPKFDKMIVQDVGPRKGLTVEKMARMKPYFDRVNGTVTVANACPITDGAVALCMMPKEKAKAEGYQILGKVRSIASAGLEPNRMGLGPVYASYKALANAGMHLRHMDLIEINEAFSAQVMACMKASASSKFIQERINGDPAVMGEVDPAKLNVNGGAVALGHPVGSSGARISLTLLKEMKRSNKRFGIASLCIGGGQGSATVFEREE